MPVEFQLAESTIISNEKIGEIMPKPIKLDIK